MGVGVVVGRRRSCRYAAVSNADKDIRIMSLDSSWLCYRAADPDRTMR